MIVRLRSRWVIIPLILFAILTGLWVLDGWLAERRWNAYAAAARARGVKLTAEELNPAPNPPIPDAQNFAATPMWKAALENRKEGKDSRLPPHFQFPGNWQPKAKSAGIAPVYDFAKLREEMIAKEWLPKNDTTGSDAEAVLRGLQRLEPYLTELHESCNRPEIHFPIDRSRGFQFNFGHGMLGLQFAKILQAKMAALISVGREPEALALWKDGMRLAEAVRSDPSVFADLVGRFLSVSMLDLTWYGMCHDVWTDESLCEMAQVLSKTSPIAEFTRGLHGERAMFNTSIASCLADPDQFQETFGEMKGGSGNKYLDWIRIRRPSWLRENQIRLNEIYEDQMQALDTRLEIRVPDAKFVYNLAAILANPGPHEELAGLCIPSLPGFRDKALFEHALVRMAEIACALEQYKRAKGAYPEKLEELLPGSLLKRLPHDPCTGTPFIYRRDPSTGFLLYSTGLDANDDNGAGKGDSPNDPDWRWFAPVKQ